MSAKEVLGLPKQPPILNHNRTPILVVPGSFPPGSTVKRFIKSIQVGYAKVRNGYEEKFCSRLHREERVRSSGLRIVCVASIEISNSMKFLLYQHGFPGPLSTPSSPRSLFKTEIYAWDVGSMKVAQIIVHHVV